MPVTLWADNSEDSQDIIKKLEAKGYIVEHVLTASESPTLRNGLSYTVGYQSIYFGYLC